MKRSEFREMYKQSLFEACQKWPDQFVSDWRSLPEKSIDTWLDKVIDGIPNNSIVITGTKNSFVILAKKLGISHTIKGIQTSLAACVEG